MRMERSDREPVRHEPPPPPPPAVKTPDGQKADVRPGGAHDKSRPAVIADGVEPSRAGPAARTGEGRWLPAGIDGVETPGTTSLLYAPVRDEQERPTTAVKLTAAERRQLLQSGATTLETEDADDGKVNCLDLAADVVDGMTPEQRRRSELLLLEDTRPGAEGRTGHVVVREGDAILDPTSGKRYRSTEEYLREHPHYQPAGTISAETTKQIFDTPPGSPERARALAQANVPPALSGMLLADPPYNPRGDLDFVDGKLSRGLFNPITDKDVDWVNLRVKEIVEDDNGKRDVNTFFAGLSDTNLRRWNDEQRDDATKRKMLATLVTELSGANAAKLAKYFGHEEVADAVAKHAPAKTKADFVTALQGSISADTKTKNGPFIPNSAVTHHDTEGNAEARAAGRVLSSLAEGNSESDKAEFNRAVKSLAQAGELDDVMKVAFRRRITLTTTSLPNDAGIPITTTSQETKFDPGALLAVIEGAKNSNDPQVKAEVLKSAGKTMAEFGVGAGESKLLAPVASALGKLITEGPHTAAVLAELRKPEVDPKGAALTDILQSYVVTGNGQAAGELAKAIFDKGTPEDHGYFRATLALAVDDLKSQIDDRKRLENYGINGAAIVAGFLNVYVGTAAALGAAYVTTDVNTGGDAKQAFDLVHARMRDTIVYPFTKEGQDRSRDAKNAVLALNDKEHLVA